MFVSSTHSKIVGALILLASLTLLPGCAAEYKTIKGSGGAAVDDPTNDDDLIIRNLNPTANVEVVFEEDKVTVVPVGKTFIVQPTDDTMDPVLESQAETCRNPGIVSATYELENKQAETVARSGQCDSLAIQTTYNQTGEYLITLTVVDGKGNEAKASMTLSVTNDGTIDTDGDTDGNDGDTDGNDGDTNGNDDNNDDDSGSDDNNTNPDGTPIANFRIDAQPLVQEEGQPINFTGLCVNVPNRIISWNFGDSSLGQGDSISHTYGQVGNYLVEAYCRDGSNKELKASLTIVIVPAGGIPNVDGDKDPKPNTDTDTSTNTDSDTDTDTTTDSSTDTGTDTDSDTDIETDNDTDPNQNPNNNPGQK